MRRTVMTSGSERISIETGDAGTVVLDDLGEVLASHGSDRHDEMVALREEAGWRVAEDKALAPPEAEGDPPPPSGPAGPAGEVDLGSSG